eukprot:scaffold13711_cov28-Tisochrysis_lutea.AAC.4
MSRANEDWGWVHVASAGKQIRGGKFPPWSPVTVRTLMTSSTSSSGVNSEKKAVKSTSHPLRISHLKTDKNRKGCSLPALEPTRDER